MVKLSSRKSKNILAYNVKLSLEVFLHPMLMPFLHLNLSINEYGINEKVNGFVNMLFISPMLKYLEKRVLPKA